MILVLTATWVFHHCTSLTTNSKLLGNLFTRRLLCFFLSFWSLWFLHLPVHVFICAWGIILLFTSWLNGKWFSEMYRSWFYQKMFMDGVRIEYCERARRRLWWLHVYLCAFNRWISLGVVVEPRSCVWRDQTTVILLETIPASLHLWTPPVQCLPTAPSCPSNSGETPQDTLRWGSLPTLQW